MHQNSETTIPADLLLVRGTCIDDDAMFSGESTPLLKESIELWEADACLDVGGAHKTALLFGGTCYDRRGSPGLTTFGRIRTCPAGNSGAKTDRVRVSNGRPAKGIH